MNAQARIQCRVLGQHAHDGLEGRAGTAQLEKVVLFVQLVPDVIVAGPDGFKIRLLSLVWPFRNFSKKIYLKLNNIANL